MKVKKGRCISLPVIHHADRRGLFPSGIQRKEVFDEKE
jgi:hypothetical protein